MYVSVGILFLNRDVGSEERAALSEALYHALNDMLSCSRGATAITTNPNRSFEAVSPLSFIATSRDLTKGSTRSGSSLHMSSQQPENSEIGRAHV